MCWLLSFIYSKANQIKKFRMCIGIWWSFFFNFMILQPVRYTYMHAYVYNVYTYSYRYIYIYIYIGDRQGNDKGTQYASVIYCTDDVQKRIATQVKDELQKLIDYKLVRCYSQTKITTDIRMRTEFFEAHKVCNRYYFYHCYNFFRCYYHYHCHYYHYHYHYHHHYHYYYYHYHHYCHCHHYHYHHHHHHHHHHHYYYCYHHLCHCNRNIKIIWWKILRDIVITKLNFLYGLTWLYMKQIKRLKKMEMEIMMFLSFQNEMKMNYQCMISSNGPLIWKLPLFLIVSAS